MTGSLKTPPLLASQVLADLGPVLTGERDLQQTAIAALELVMSAGRINSAALFRFQEKPAMLSSIASSGFALFPKIAVFPLLPKHVHALSHASGPQRLCEERSETFLSSTGNFSAVWFRYMVPLRVRGKLVGALMLGERDEGAGYSSELLKLIGELAPLIALAIHNHQLMMSLQERTAENLRLIASVHSFWEEALEAFAATIDAKHVHMRGHSLRVGRYAAVIAEAIGVPTTEVTELRSAGYLHDIGKVNVDKYLFGKPTALEPLEYKEMIDHTVIGHQIVSTVQFPWPHIPEVVRSHHERADGSGYPDHLRSDEVSLPVKIVAVADTFDAMLSDRPYRTRHSLGEAASQISRLAPDKLDAEIVLALLVQLRREAVDFMAPPRPWATQENRPKNPFLGADMACNLSPLDIDHLASELNRRVNRGRSYLS
ncbi:MAG TPA: HD domain-containing phosphohydrolase [Candidatus Angelobacter sp.]|nr:HD domain-containing phosphohydrolase [Candidatus Angelobacter sp.]